MTSTWVRIILLLATICLPHSAGSAQTSQLGSGTLSLQQAEVWKQEVNYFQYWQARDFKKYMSLWDDRFVGWPGYLEHPVRKREIETEVAEEFRAAQTTPTAVPNPESIVVSGDVAVTYYILNLTDGLSQFRYRVSHTWLKGPSGWHIIGGMSCDVSQTSAKQ
jgi:ketosteroid isomerase-like protein